MAIVRTLLDKPRYVWFECNSQSIVNEWQLVATEWQQIGGLIATTRDTDPYGGPDLVIDYTTQMLATPGVTNLIGGLKFSDFFDYAGGDTLYEVTAWQAIRDKLAELATLTGMPVVIDNEGNLNNARSNGITSVDAASLQAAVEGVLGTWPLIWHWYGPVGESEPARQMALDWAIGIKAGIPSLHFIESNSSGYVGSPGYPPAVENLARTLALDPAPYSIVYLDDVAANQWNLADAQQTIQYVRGQATILYPGYGDLNNYAAVQASYAAAPPPTCRVNLPAGVNTYNVEVP